MDKISGQIIDDTFRPRRLVRSGQAQTVLSMWRPKAVVRVRDRESPILLDAGPDMTGYAPDEPVRLLGYYTLHYGDEPARGLVLLLHGWGGSSHSTYGLVTADALC